MTPDEFKQLTVGISQARLAEIFGRSASTVYSYASGRKPIPLDVALRARMLAEAIDRVSAAKLDEVKKE